MVSGNAGERMQGNLKNSRVTVELGVELATELYALAAEDYMPVASYIRMIIAKHVKSRKNEIIK